MSGLPREVIKWLQSLDLTYTLRIPRRDFSNGYLVAEVLAWYLPQEIQMHSYSSGAALQAKLANWQLIEKIFSRQKIDIPKEIVEGTIHCKPSAAIILMEKLYTFFTRRELHCPPRDRPDDLTDNLYQHQLPPHARSTASQSIKNNLAITELETEKDLTLSSLRTQAILEAHLEQRQQERKEFPDRFHKHGKKKISPAKPLAENTKLPEVIVKQRAPPTPPEVEAGDVE